MSDVQAFERWCRLGAEFAQEMALQRIAVLQEARTKLQMRIADLDSEEAALVEQLKKLGGSNGCSTRAGE